MVGRYPVRARANFNIHGFNVLGLYLLKRLDIALILTAILRHSLFSLGKFGFDIARQIVISCHPTLYGVLINQVAQFFDDGLFIFAV